MIDDIPWTSRTPEDRRRILTAPFPIRNAGPSYPWAGALVSHDEQDEIMQRAIAQHHTSDESVMFETVIRLLEE